MEALMVWAAVLQLLGLYRQEKRARTDLDHRDFYEWLIEHRFEELKDQISETYHLGSEVDKLLREDHATILEKLDVANKMLADILGHVEAFSGITKTVLPSFGLSDDAVKLLRFFADSGDETLIPTPSRGVFLLLESRQKFGLMETRFLDDDLESLVNHGLLIRLHVNSTNTPGYRLTRRATQFLKMAPHGPAIVRKIVS